MLTTNAANRAMGGNSSEFHDVVAFVPAKLRINSESTKQECKNVNLLIC